MVAGINKNDVHIAFVVPIAKFEYIGVGLLASCLRVRGFSNITVSQFDSPDLEALIKRSRLVILAFCAFTTDVDKLLRRSRALKARYDNFISIFGGPHATFSPEMIESEGVDAVCIGEGEEAFPEFVEKYAENSGEIPKDVRNWWIKDNRGLVHKNPLRPLITNLDFLPFEDKSLFLNCIFFKKGFRRFVFSRGCPNNCNFCSINAFPKVYNISFREYYRVRSPESAVREIGETVDKYGGKIVGIIDSIFGLDIEWLDKFAFYYEKNIKLPFYCNAEAKIVTRGYVDCLKRAGCKLVFMGLETGSADVRAQVLNKRFDDTVFNNAVKALKDARIKVGIYNIIGIPKGNLQEDLSTLRMNQMIDPYMTFCGMFFSSRAPGYPNR